MEKQRYKITNSAEDESIIFIDLDENEAKLLDKVFNQLNDGASTYAPSIKLTKLS